MTIDYHKLKNRKFPDLVHSYTERDTILYALGLGCGVDPMNRADLRFVYEDGLRVLPTMAVVLGYPGFWLKEPDTGVDWRQLLHGEQGLILHMPLPASGTVIGRSQVVEIVDKGKDKGALLYSKREVFDRETGDLLCELTSTTVLRADGGFGGPAGPSLQPHPIPDTDPQLALDFPTAPQAALIYRLSGDFNPLHADPAVAATAGFPRPILHGLCTFGIAGRAVLRGYCEDDQTRLKEMRVRFSAPVFPGETIRTEFWRDGDTLSFRARALERNTVVLNNGFARLA